jgi:hypothetical protein
MLSKRDVQFGQGPAVAPDTFIRGSDPKAHPHYGVSKSVPLCPSSADTAVVAAPRRPMKGETYRHRTNSSSA